MKEEGKCSICGAEYEDRCEHNPSHNFPIKQNGFENESSPEKSLRNEEKIRGE